MPADQPVLIGSVSAVGWAFLLTSLIIVAMPDTGVLITIGAGLSRVPHLLAAVTGATALLQASGKAFAASFLGLGAKLATTR